MIMRAEASWSQGRTLPGGQSREPVPMAPVSPKPCCVVNSGTPRLELLAGSGGTPEVWLLAGSQSLSVLLLQPVLPAGAPIMVGQQNTQGREERVIKFRRECLG